MIHTARQLKDLVRNKSKSDSKKAQSLIRIYCMERFLERLSVSPYKKNFILKGGILVSSMVGVDRRVTMDIDTTIKGQNLSVEDARRIISEIISIPLEDGIRFELLDAGEIMEGAEYTGVRIHLNAWLEKMKTPIKIDISTGDIITPREINYSYRLMFEDREINLLSYNLVTTLAEKIETVISRGTANTRLRDFYDIYVLSDTYADEKEWGVLDEALRATSRKRGSQRILEESDIILQELYNDEGMRHHWENYQKKNDYATDLSWEEIMDRINKLCSIKSCSVKGNELIIY